MPHLEQQGVFLEFDGRVDDIKDNMKSIMIQVSFRSETKESL